MACLTDCSVRREAQFVGVWPDGFLGKAEWVRAGLCHAFFTNASRVHLTPALQFVDWMDSVWRFSTSSKP